MCHNELISVAKHYITEVKPILDVLLKNDFAKKTFAVRTIILDRGHCVKFTSQNYISIFVSHKFHSMVFEADRFENKSKLNLTTKSEKGC